MKHAVLLILLIVAGKTCAQESVTFQPPQPHDLQRYEAGWNKNPFTLKTAPPVVESVSFARDLAIATYYGDSSDPTIMVVNTKTKERIRLKKDQPAANGMKLSSVKLGSSRKDLVVEIALGTETAAIRYDDSYLKQLAASEMSKSSSAQQQMRQQSGAQPSATQQKIPQLPPPVDGVKTASAPPVRPGFVAPTGTHDPGKPPPGGTPLVSQNASSKGVPQMPVRNRLAIPTHNAASVSQ